MKKILLIALGLFLLLGACVLTDQGPFEITYKVFGSGTSEASLTFETPEGTSQQVVTLPWQRSYSFPAGSFVYLSAQNEEDYGCITAQILVDVEVEGRTWRESWKKVESCGGYVIASVSGRID